MGNLYSILEKDHERREKRLEMHRQKQIVNNYNMYQEQYRTKCHDIIDKCDRFMKKKRINGECTFIRLNNSNPTVIENNPKYPCDGQYDYNNISISVKNHKLEELHQVSIGDRGWLTFWPSEEIPEDWDK